MFQKTVFAFASLVLLQAFVPQDVRAQTANSGEDKGRSSTSSSSFRMGTGFSYSKGDYGEIEDTKVFAVPLSATYKQDGFKIRISVPWVRIDGPGSLLQTPEGRDGGGFDSGGSGSNSGSGGSNSGSGSSGSGGGIEVEDTSGSDLVDDDGITDSNGVVLPSRRRSGFGDVNVAISYNFELGRDFYFEPTAKIKMPTASKSKRLGTGKVDVTLGGELIKDVGAASFYVHGRRKFAGKPTGSTIRSTWGAGGGASVRAGEVLTIGADYDWQQSAFAGRAASSEVTGWASARLSDRLNLTFFAGTGLNSSSADFMGGAGISYRF